MKDKIIEIDNILIRLSIANNQLVSLHHASLTEVEFIPQSEDPLFDEITSQLQAYFAGELKQFKIPINYEGTEFQQKVLSTMTKVPYGSTITYTELAHNAGFPEAVRAVASVCRFNKIPIIIPCHRIIRKNKSFGNYSFYNKDFKPYLLRLEGAIL